MPQKVKMDKLALYSPLQQDHVDSSCTGFQIKAFGEKETCFAIKTRAEHKFLGWLLKNLHYTYIRGTTDPEKAEAIRFTDYDKLIVDVEREYQFECAYYHVSIQSTDQNLFEEVVKATEQFPLMFKYPEPGPQLGTIYVLVQDPMYGLQFHEIATIGEKLERGNYSKDVIQQYDRILEDLASRSPRGRLSLLSGAPGTGKTHAIRGLINDAQDFANFILVPSNAVNQLSSPNFLKLLLQHARSDQAMVLVVEDADEALRKRGTGTDTELSALLNFSDGIFGAMLDARVICTTNLSLDEIDPAIIRPGRLSEQISIGKLSAEEATEVWLRLSGGLEKCYKKELTLAEIYIDAKPYIKVKPRDLPPKQEDDEDDEDLYDSPLLD